MPKSRVRKKKVYHSKSGSSSSTGDQYEPSPAWVPATAVGLIVFGIAWLTIFYLSGQEYPVLAWGNWNLAVGFVSMVLSLLVLSRWK
ncbi:cell division protein CrgA [Haloglycomyces albus]|uniref:cell division protein CrgA n=1 Tax=Haloglycomyces albus TaxID=526067 RepID=UPI00046D013C|nr:cell division protein CrgA [Haloglycomyces albus]